MSEWMTSTKDNSNIQSHNTDTLCPLRQLKNPLTYFSDFYTAESYRLWDQIYPHGSFTSETLPSLCPYLHNWFRGPKRTLPLSLLNLNLISSKSLISLVDHFHWHKNLLKTVQQASKKYILQVKNKENKRNSFP